MFEIIDDKIRITKGDSAKLTVTLDNYTMASGDTLTMSVRQKPTSAVLMAVTSSTNVITLTPTDTKKLIVGQCCYDIELKTAGGDVYTVVGVRDGVYIANMTVYPEITV